MFLENLSIVWEEITRAKEPVTYYELNGNKYFDLIKPFSNKSKNGKRYAFFAVKIVSDNLGWNRFPIITTLSQLFTDGRLRYCFGTPQLKNTTILGIEDGVTKLYGAYEHNPSLIAFYGGYISF